MPLLAAESYVLLTAAVSGTAGLFEPAWSVHEMKTRAVHKHVIKYIFFIRNDYTFHRDLAVRKGLKSLIHIYVFPDLVAVFIYYQE